MTKKIFLFLLFSSMLLVCLAMNRTDIQIVSKRAGDLQLPEKKGIIDIHNHDASTLSPVLSSDTHFVPPTIQLWKDHDVTRTVLFGAVSDPKAVATDRVAWNYYEKYPDAIIPSISGFPLRKGSNGEDYLRDQLEKGVPFIGEIFVASTYSAFSDAKWKAKNAYDGNLPAIYELAAQYDVPVLIHIDPLNTFQLTKLKLAAAKHPNTTIILAHANVFSSLDDLEDLLKTRPNIMLDFFAGFTDYNEASSYELSDFIPLMEKYPNRWVLGSDSGYEVGMEQSLQAMQKTSDLLRAETRDRITQYNAYEMIYAQEMTASQKQRIHDSLINRGERKVSMKLFKMEANKWLLENEN
ncbi:amidohydrolase family protein [Paenisporosarcina cavernae]|uniref:Amidohydrolase n=1 Tax=Paenisporosarcina cavernae TaxID=2320858 RepID=A0A385YV77_9BACL|nr:amidohydrolase family protein [Paenisporosarcina cavernae]AYC30454.1 amidohydrolase [Paenisporosarcina cavernae]